LEEYPFSKIYSHAFDGGVNIIGKVGIIRRVHRKASPLYEYSSPSFAKGGRHRGRIVK